MCVFYALLKDCFPSIHPSIKYPVSLLNTCLSLHTDRQKYATIQLPTPSPLIFLIGELSLTSQVDHVKLENIRLELTQGQLRSEPDHT